MSPPSSDLPRVSTSRAQPTADAESPGLLPPPAGNAAERQGLLGVGLIVVALGLLYGGYAVPAALTMIGAAGLGLRAFLRRRWEAAQLTDLLAAQAHVLEKIATGASLGEVLDALCLLMERQKRGLICSVLLLEGDRLRDGSGPSLPAAYRRAVDGIQIGPGVGSCGTAAYRRRPVVVRDIATDPLWSDYRDLALPHGLAACWSVPILTPDGECLGTFAMYYRERQQPGAREWRLLETASNIARVAIMRARTAEALAASRRQLQEESDVAGALAYAGHGLISSIDKPGIVDRLCRLTTELLGLDASVAILRDGDDDAYVPLIVHGHPPDRWTALRGRRWPATEIAPLLERAAAARVLRLLPGDAPAGIEADLLRDLGPGGCLLVPLRHGDETLGLLSVGARQPLAAFTPAQERVAAGIGQLASLAFENARLMEELAAATQGKLEFISTISHELRTPIGVILGYAEMLGEDGDALQRTAWLTRIRRAGRELLELIDATLNLNRLDAGQDPPRLEAVGLRDFVEELAADFAGVTRPAGVELRWEPGDDVALVTDRRKLRMVMKNLVGNALKFTPAGSVTVRYRVGEATCTFEVVDTGVGIAPESLPVIFEMFRQAHGSDQRSFSGVGLGLHIVRRLVDQLGGEVRVVSARGQGSTFSVVLPRAQNESRLSA
jgi:signal transduction histidine kinase